MRVLKVRGKGSVSQKPDLVVFNFVLTGKDMNYEKAIDELNRKSAILRSDVIRAGFSGDDLKTTNFRVETVYNRVNNHKVFEGYLARQDLKLSFDFDRQVLNDLLLILSDSLSEPEFTIFFEVKDEASFKDELLRDAVNKAKKNAKVIADAANVRLGKILNIVYDFQDIIVRSPMAFSMEKAYAVDIVPEDVLATDDVLIEWEIEDYL